MSIPGAILADAWRPLNITHHRSSSLIIAQYHSSSLIVTHRHSSSLDQCCWSTHTGWHWWSQPAEWCCQNGRANMDHRLWPSCTYQDHKACIQETQNCRRKYLPGTNGTRSPSLKSGSVLWNKAFCAQSPGDRSGPRGTRRSTPSWRASTCRSRSARARCPSTSRNGPPGTRRTRRRHRASTSPASMAAAPQRRPRTSNPPGTWCTPPGLRACCNRPRRTPSSRRRCCRRSSPTPCRRGTRPVSWRLRRSSSPARSPRTTWSHCTSARACPDCTPRRRSRAGADRDR